MFLATCAFLMSSLSMASAQTSCALTMYGVNCTMACPTHCVDSGSSSIRMCDSNNGTCLQGCKDGYKGSLCEQTCPSGTYGKDCKMNCSQQCRKSDSRICENVNGNCYGGCLDGYMGAHCDTICNSKTYGRNCSQICSINCLPPGTCDPVNGACNAGCADGFFSSACDKPCASGNYGKDCKLSCPQHCSKSAASICENVRGVCNGGCDEGFIGTFCNISCSTGTFGKDCKSTCSANCKQLGINGLPLCESVSGSCTGGCRDGYTNPHCDASCRYNTYGAGCSSSCSTFCAQPDQASESPCNHVTGICQFGCKTGYQGQKCTEECKLGYYGSECKNSCSEFCTNNTTAGRACHHVSGNCLQGCATGHEGPTCMSFCRIGTYGKNCSSPCNEICVSSSNAKESPCHPITGDCIRGCTAGYTGPICASESKDPEKSTKIGLIVGLCLAIVAFISALGVLVYYRRKEKTPSIAKKQYEVPEMVRHESSTDNNPDTIYLEPVTTQQNTDNQYEPIETSNRHQSQKSGTYENGKATQKTDFKETGSIYQNVK